MSKALTDDVVAELKQKHGALYVAECELGRLVYRHPGPSDVDPYLLGTVRGEEQEAANNLVFACRVWPDVATVEKMFDEAPAVVSKFAEIIVGKAGAGEDDMIGLLLRDPAHIKDAERVELEARAGKGLDVILNELPRGSAKVTTLPGYGAAIFRRPTRGAYAPFVDAAKKDELLDACRTLCAECSVTVSERDLSAVFASKAAVPFYLAFALGALAGGTIEVREGKL